MAAPIPLDDDARLRALHDFGVLDTPPEDDYDGLTRLVAAVCGTPLALVSLVDRDRQWFKSRVGTDATETPRDFAFCGHAILSDGVFVVPDATDDERFRDNPLVTGEPHVRFYAGAPLTTPEGHNIGTLCAIDHVPRTLTTEQLDALRVLARQVIAQLVLRRQVASLRAAEAELRAERERFRAFMDNSPAVAYMKDTDGRFVFVNETLRKKFAAVTDQWIGKTDHDLFAAEFADQYRDHDLRVLAGAETVIVSETTPGADGEPAHWQSYKFPFVDGTGQRLLAGMSVDVTTEKKALEALRDSETKFRTTVDRLAEGVFVVDAATGRFVEANAAVLTLLGYTSAEFLGLAMSDIVAEETPDVIARNVQHIHAKLGADGRCDLGRKHLRHRNGESVAVDVRVTAVPNGGAGLHAVVVRDVTEQAEYEDRLYAYQLSLEEANAKLRSLSVTDALTGAKNRGAFNARLTDEFGRAERTGGALSVVMMDVDHFKQFNDTFGHPAGDEVLKTVAATLAGAARATDLVARYGGEEFAVIMPDTDFAGAMVLAERCRRAIAAVRWSQRPVTVSVGVATRSPGTGTAAALVQEADQALYRSKQGGRNRVTHGSGTAAPPAPRTLLAPPPTPAPV